MTLQGKTDTDKAVCRPAQSSSGLTGLLDSLALFELVGFMVVRQGDGVAVFVAEDAAGVAHVGHRQLLVGQQGHQTRRTWGSRGGSRGGGENNAKNASTF